MSVERDHNRIGFEEITKTAREVLLQNGQHMPLLIVDGSKNLVISQIQLIPDTHDERMEMMRLLGHATAKSGKIGRLEQVFFVSEGWMSVTNDGKMPDFKPSHDPQRKEVLIVSGQEIRSEKKSLKLFEMLRNKNKKVVDLPELSTPEGRQGEIDIPLIDAYVEGFQEAFREQAN